MAGNVFDNMNDENREFAPVSAPAPSNEGRFTVQFGTEAATVALRTGITVRDSFIMNADFLGFDPDRMLTYRDDQNNLLTGHETPVANRVYTAAITHDEKG